MKNIRYHILIACLFVLLTAAPALAAFGRVTGQVVSVPTNLGFDTSIVYTLPNPVTSGNTVVGSITLDVSGGATITSITDDKGNTYNQGTLITDTDDNQVGLLFWLGNITNGPSTVTVALSVSAGARGGIMREYTGVIASSNPSDGTTQQYQPSPGTGANAVSSGSITTTTNGDGIVAFTINSDGGSGAISVGTGFTIDQTTAGMFANEDRTQTTAGSIAGTFGIATNGEMLTFILALKTSGSPPPTGGTIRSLTGVGK